MTATMTTEDLVRRFIEGDVNTPDGALTDEIVAENFVDHTNPPGMQHGRDGHRAILALFHSAFPGLKFEIDDIFVGGDRVGLRLTMRGTHKGDFFGIPATGKDVTVEGTHVLRIADGQVAEHWGTNDDLGMMRQLGAIPG
ncbi:MAG: ester cyclase [Candidatus Dormiibacterota bacterium]